MGVRTRYHDRRMSHDQILVLPLWYAVFLLSVTCHEAAHAWVAYRGGDETAYLGGQVTLNPLPHIRREPFGTVLVPFLTYSFMGFMMGWASAPYDPVWEQRYPRRAAAMAVAGPASNLVLAALGFAALKIGLAAEIWMPFSEDSTTIDRLVVPVGAAGGAIEGLGRVCSLMLSLNILLCLFNLIPLPPLDGASVVAGLSSRARAALDNLRASGVGGLIGLLVAMYAIRKLFPPVLHFVLGLLFGGL
jgi:Zn-dependent protease